MDQIREFIDERLKGTCIYCEALTSELEVNRVPMSETRSSASHSKSTRDHVPSKSLLKEPYPAHLPVIDVCGACNHSFSLDEEYFAAFLGAVLAGSTEPDLQVLPSAARILRRNAKLKTRIDQSRTQRETPDGETQLLWIPEWARINRVIVKNARGHALYEYGDPNLVSGPPRHIRSTILEDFTDDQRDHFENVDSDTLSGWPEVGSKMMTRVVTGQDLSGPWVVVQDGVYRYAVAQVGRLLVRTVLFEYVATEVYWDDD